MNIKATSFLLSLFLIHLTGCQLVKINEYQIDQAVQYRTHDVVSSQKLSVDTTSLLKLLNYSEKSCLQQFDNCAQAISTQDVIRHAERYSALSELYLAQARTLEKKSSLQSKDQIAQLYDLSLRYSYAYLFKSGSNPNVQTFDLRQMQVRTFYNYALSRVIHLSYQNSHHNISLPAVFNVGTQQYFVDTQHYPELKNMKIEHLQSSYVLNFTGFDKVNRQDGLGAEFIMIRELEPQVANEFILDPMQEYANQDNPRIHYPRYLSVTATVQPKNALASAEEIIAGTPFQLSLYNPYRYATGNLNNQAYTLTANYTAPYAFWLAQNQLGKSAYLSLLDKVETLRMPHVYMLEPYQPNKKVIVLIHGLASSPETWMNLTNNILGDPILRANYQVWMVSYSTNMPIMESRFQIQALLKQAFAQTDVGSASSSNAVLIGHSMGGIISRLLVSKADISEQAIPLMNYEQYTRLQQNPVIAERFQLNADLPFSRAVFVAAPHRGSDLTDRWYVEWAKKLVKLPTSFFDQVNIQLNGSTSTKGLVHSGPDDLSPTSRFMQLTKDVVPNADFPYHSIIGNAKNSNDPEIMSDGIVPYSSSHLEQAQSEKIFKGGHSIHAKSETILELRRILHEHLAKP